MNTKDLTDDERQIVHRTMVEGIKNEKSILEKHKSKKGNLLCFKIMICNRKLGGFSYIESGP